MSLTKNNAAQVEFLQAGTGAVTRTLAAKVAEFVSVKDFGAVGDGVTDDTLAIQAAITYCKASKTKNLTIPAGVYLVSSTLDFDVLKVFGEGVQWQSGLATELRANASNILVAKIGSSGRLSNLVVNGNNLALWGLMVGGARSTLDSIEVVRCTEYGCIFNAAQNCAIYNLNCRFNYYGLVLANGTRNCNFYNFTSSIETGPSYGGATAAMRNIVFLVDITNPHGFGLSTSVTTVGNDRNNFFGGISETFAANPDYVLETRNPNSWVGQAAHSNAFYGYEFTGSKGLFQTDSTFTGTFLLYNCALLAGSDSVAMGSGTTGTIMFHGNTYFNGSANFSNRGITQKTNLANSFYISSNELVSPTVGVDYYLEGGGSTVAFNSTTKTFSVSGGTSVQGVGLILRYPGEGNTTVSGITSRTIKPVYRITYNVANIVGGSGTVSVYAPLNGSPWRRKIADVSAGAGQLLYKCQGDEGGGVAFTLNGATSFDVSDIKVDVI